MKQRGRKSAASLSVVRSRGRSRPPPPTELDPEAAALWREIVAGYPDGWFNAGDLVLLREFCFTAATLLPESNGSVQAGGAHAVSMRNMHVKTLAMLASKLRLNVSARTRADTASTRDASKPSRGVNFREEMDR